MSPDDTQRIISDLNDYTNIKQKISILRYELEHPVTVSPEEMLESMNFAHGRRFHRWQCVKQNTVYCHELSKCCKPG